MFLNFFFEGLKTQKKLKIQMVFRNKADPEKNLKQNPKRSGKIAADFSCNTPPMNNSFYYQW